MTEVGRWGNGVLDGGSSHGRHRTVHRTFSLLLGVLLALVPQASSAQEACCDVKVSASEAAQWDPSPQLLDKMRESCGSKLDAPGSRCLLEWMTKDNAAYDAMAFSRSIGVRGYLRHYRQEGVIGVAYVVFPGEKTDRYGTFLVNGDPFRFNPDDTSLPLPKGLQHHPRYLALAEQHWSLTLLPGDRRDEQEPLVMPGAQGGKRFLFAYKLSSNKEGQTHSDSLLVWICFDASGKFTGRELESIGNAE